MEQIVLAKFCDPHIGAPQLRLHDVRVEMAQASRELPLCFRWIGLGEIEVQIRHGWLLIRCGSALRLDMHSSKRQVFPGALSSVHTGCFNAAASTGSFRKRLPVAAKIALVTAGTMAEVPGSPIPPGGSKFWTMWTSMAGASFMRRIW